MAAQRVVEGRRSTRELLGARAAPKNAYEFGSRRPRERVLAKVSRSMGAAATLSLAALLPCAGGAQAAEIKIFTAAALGYVLDRTGSQFEHSTGNRLNVIVGFSPVFSKRINAGEPFDVAIAPPGSIKALIKRGHIAADTRTDLVRAVQAVEVRAGAPKPDISSAEALKRSLLEARSIVHLPTPPMKRLMERLGIADAVRSKTTITREDTVSEVVARGDAQIGIITMAQILATPGVDLVGPLPPEVREYTTFTAGVSTNSHAPAAAHALIRFLAGPATTDTIKALGMERAK